MSSYTCFQKGDIVAKIVDITVYAGRTLRQTGGVAHKVAELLIHPRRNQRKKAFDQALLRLERSIQISDQARPICLPRGKLASPTPGSLVMASGWGSVDPTKMRQGRHADMFVNLSIGQIIK